MTRRTLDSFRFAVNDILPVSNLDSPTKSFDAMLQANWIRDWKGALRRHA